MSNELRKLLPPYITYCHIDLLGNEASGATRALTCKRKRASLRAYHGSIPLPQRFSGAGPSLFTCGDCYALEARAVPSGHVMVGPGASLQHQGLGGSG